MQQTAINNSTLPISYREFNQKIEAGRQVTIQQPYNYFRVLSSDTDVSDLYYRFGAVATETQISVGIGLNYPETMPSVTIRNAGNADANLRLCFMQGVIADDRLNITGTVIVQKKPDSTFDTQTMTFGESGSLNVNSIGYNNVLIQNLSNSATISIGPFIVQPGGTFEKDLSAELTITGTDGEKIAVGLFK